MFSLLKRRTPENFDHISLDVERKGRGHEWTACQDALEAVRAVIGGPVFECPVCKTEEQVKQVL